MKALNFLYPKESFFVLEILPNGAINGLLVKLDNDKKLIPKRIWENATWKQLAGYFGENRLVKNIIVSADPSLAYTAVIQIKLSRDNSTIPLEASELENLLGRAVGKVFNQCRQEASKHLDIDDLDVVLANSRVCNFKIDGHGVLNPLGFEAQKIEGTLELTLTRRDILDNLKNFLKGKKSFFFTETCRAELSVLNKIHKLPIGVISIKEENTLCFEMFPPVSEQEVITRGEFDWGWGSLLKAIMKEWKVSQETAKDIYFTYLRKEMSENGLKCMNKILDSATKAFLMKISDSGLKGRFFLDSLTPLPFEMPLKKRGLNLEEPPLNELISRFGFEIEPEDWNMPSARVFKWLVPVFDLYTDRSNSNVNHWLRRHLNWLGSPVSHSRV